jgi:hypothetical protein
MDEENNIQGNKALGSNNQADGEVNESSRAGETNTPDYIPEDLILNIESPKCLRCNKERKIYSFKLCKSCYNYLHLNKEKHKANVERWMERNSNYFKEYYLLKKIKLKQLSELK